MKKAFVYFAEGFEEIEAITIVDVLRRAGIPTLTISITGRKEVTGAHNIKMNTDALFEEVDADDAEILILPGGLPGADNLNAHAGLKNQLRLFNEQGRKLAAICAAPQVLGGLDILNGQRAVCYPGFEEKLTGADIQYEAAIKSGNVITGRGPGAALDFALMIVSELKGAQLADTLARGMLVQTW
ncbi:MAG: DJ-1/PfpI family protein [Bacteroidales bacterium]|nr:DJ-1/PfpI family protein [Bacteroidales bacterium]